MPTTPLEFDVTIAGGGAAGATLALALAGAGLRTALIDAHALSVEAAEDDGRASAVAAANWRQWRVLGVADALAATAQPITRIVVADGPGPGASASRAAPSFLQFEAEDAAGDPSGPLGWMVENGRMRAVLGAAVREAGVTVLAPARLARVDTGTRLARIGLADGRELVSPVLVGADGRDSFVRRAAGVGVNGWSYRQWGVVAAVALDTPHEGEAQQSFLAGGPLAVLPLTGDRASLVWTERPDLARALAEASPAAFEAHLARRFGERLGRPRLIGPRSAYPLRLQIAQALTARRTALIGDAAHVIHPIAGQGLNTGLKDAAALAQVLVEAHRLGEDIGGDAVLGRYARWRRFDATTLALATDLFTRLFALQAPPVRLARRLGLSLVDRAPALKRGLVREAGASLGDLPLLLRGEAL